jgi:hypothetical protein
MIRPLPSPASASASTVLAVDNLDLIVRAVEFYALVGPIGAARPRRCGWCWRARG